MKTYLLYVMNRFNRHLRRNIDQLTLNMVNGSSKVHVMSVDIQLSVGHKMMREY